MNVIFPPITFMFSHPIMNSFKSLLLFTPCSDGFIDIRCTSRHRSQLNTARGPRRTAGISLWGICPFRLIIPYYLRDSHILYTQSQSLLLVWLSA